MTIEEKDNIDNMVENVLMAMGEEGNVVSADKESLRFDMKLMVHKVFMMGYNSGWNAGSGSGAYNGAGQ